MTHGKNVTVVLAILAVLAVAGGCTHTNTTTPAAASSPDPLQASSVDELYAEGIRHRDAGDLIRAEQYLASAWKRGDKNGRAFNALMAVCLSADRFHAALDHAQLELSRDPDNLKLRYLVATLHFSTENYAPARQQLESLIEASPTDPASHYLIAMVDIESGGDSQTASTHLRRYLDSAPSGPRARDAASWLKRLEKQAASPAKPSATGRPGKKL